MDRAEGAAGEGWTGPDRALLAALLHHVDEAVVALDAEGRITWASPAVRTLLGHDPSAIVGTGVLELLHPDEAEAALDSVLRWAGRPGAPRGQVQRVRAADGTWVPLRYDALAGPQVAAVGDLVLTLRRADHGGAAPAGADLRARDETGARLVRLASAFLDARPSAFDAALDAAMADLSGLEWVTRLSVWRRLDRRFVRRATWEAAANRPEEPLPERLPLDGSALLRRLGALEEVHVRSVAHLPDDWQEDREALAAAGVRSALAVPLAAAGRCEGFLLAEVTLEDATFDASHLTTLRSAAAILTAAFARHDAEAELRRRALQDPLTGLGNRFAFDELLEAAVARLGRGRSRGVAVALIDLDRFKVVNDALGHRAGDRLLAEVIARMAAATTEGTTMARLGGDELLVLHDDVADVDEAVARTQDLVQALATPFDLGDRPWVLTASVGVAHADDAGVAPGELLRRADVAMYRAKAAGGARIATDDEATRTEVARRVRREGELRAALDARDLVVHHQGEWDLRTGRLVGAEALVRWPHPDEGLLTAAEFIPMAEESDLIVPLGTWVLEQACRELAAWRAAGLDEGFVLRVNLSARQLRQDGLVAQVAGVLERTGVDAAALCLELTESALLADPEGAVALLGELRHLGVGLAVDDFGTGYSSMLYLKRLPLTSLKIDRAFVAGLPDDHGDEAIVRACLQLAEALDLEVTAEGVEDGAQRDALVALGCHRAQGFLLSRPEPATDLAGRLGLG